MKILRYLFIVIVVIFGLTFAVLNAQDVTLNYYIGVITLPLSLILVAALVVGGLLGILASLRLLLCLKRENSLLQQRIKQQKMAGSASYNMSASGDH